MKVLRLGLLLLSCFSLQSCLLLFFLAPKTTAERLPGSVELQSFKDVYSKTCSKCHILVDPKYFKTNATIESILKRYRKQKVITKAEAREISTYINVVIEDLL